MLWLASILASQQAEEREVSSPTEEEEEQPQRTPTGDPVETVDEAPQPEEPRLPIQEPTGANHEGTSGKPERPQGIPFSVPAAPALRTRRDLARALRPLMRKEPSRSRFDLDESATVQRIADTEVWIPVTHPRQERWLELDLVMEASKTTAIWERAIAELKHLVEYQGAFRTIRTWRLATKTEAENDGCPVLLRGWQGHFQRSAELPDGVSKLGARPRNPKELIDASGRRIIWVVSDCVSPLWRSGAIAQPGNIYDWLGLWGKAQPVAILQMFPARLWSRTALGRGQAARFGALSPGVTNRQLAVTGLPRRLIRRRGQGLLNVPVVTLEADSLEDWARTIAGRGEVTVPGRVFDLVPRKSRRSPVVDPAEDESPAIAISEPTALERVRQFRANAKPTVLQLAMLMAATPVSLPVIDLLRQEFREEFDEEVRQHHVAEVLLSGLLRRVDGKEESTCRYAFFGDESVEPDQRVRDILLGGASRSQTERVLDVLSESICQRLGLAPKSFEALLGDIQEESELRDTALPFANIGLSVLRRMGGEYAAVANSYDPEQTGTVTVRKRGDRNEIQLETIEFDVAVFERDTSPIALEPFEFETFEVTGVDDFVSEASTHSTIVMFGHRASGKTSYISALYQCMSIGTNTGLQLLASNAEHHRSLRRQWNDIRSASSTGTGWLDITQETTSYHFDLLFGMRQKICSLSLTDYRGGLIDELSVSERELYQDELNTFQNYLGDASCMIIFISAEFLQQDRDVFETADVTGASRLLRSVNHTSFVKENAPSIVIAITKYDLCRDRNISEVIEDIKQIFPAFFAPGSKWLTMVCPISLINSRGNIGPMNIELPLLFSLYTQLLRVNWNDRDDTQSEIDNERRLPLEESIDTLKRTLDALFNPDIRLYFDGEEREFASFLA